MPVSRMSLSKRGGYSLSGKSSYDERVFVDVNVIIKIDEIVRKRLTEYGQSDCY